MWPDTIDFSQFYSSPLGARTRNVICRHLLEAWPDVKGARILGIGFPHPYLGIFKNTASFTFSAVPSSHGLSRWPEQGYNLSCLISESELPLSDLSVDRVLIIHLLEHTEQVRPLMREIWRVLSESGQIVVIVPNRRGIWSQTERTPFGYGKPYSFSQILKLLSDTMFVPVSSCGALYAPPVNSRFISTSATNWEKIGKYWLRGFGGVVSVKAKKEMYAPTLELNTRFRRTYATIPNN